MSRKKLNAFGMASNVKHVRLYAWIQDSAAWRAASVGERALLLEVWRRHNGEHNGAISMSVREAAESVNASTNTVMKWFHGLEEKGFLKARSRGSFRWKRSSATTWELTMERCDNRPASKEFMRWKVPRKQNTVSNSGPRGLKICDTRHENDADGIKICDRDGQIVPIHGIKY